MASDQYSQVQQSSHVPLFPHDVNAALLEINVEFNNLPRVNVLYWLTVDILLLALGITIQCIKQFFY